MPAPDLTLWDMVLNFSRNRTEFYSTVLTRTPENVLRVHLETIGKFSTESAERVAQLRLPSSLPFDDFLIALATLDLMKKPSHGSILGRTTISVDESLSRAEQIEETGILLYSHLSNSLVAVRSAFGDEVEIGKRAYAAILRLHDELRYHRVSLTP